MIFKCYLNYDIRKPLTGYLGRFWAECEIFVGSILGYWSERVPPKWLDKVRDLMDRQR